MALSQITSRDRVLAAIDHRQTDRIPIAFQGGIDIQNTMPNAEPADVVREVKTRAETLGESGGYIFGTAHNLLPDVPTENIVALFEAYMKHGRYD